MTFSSANSILIAARVISLGCFLAFSGFIGGIKDGDEFFKIEIFQDGEIVPVENGKVTIKKKPFKFRVTLINTDHVDVSASWGKYYYDYSENESIYKCPGKGVDNCRFVAIKTGNQDKFNTEKDLAVGDGDYQWAWFYDEALDWHRFDKGAKVSEGIVTAEMTVENIFDCDARDCWYSPNPDGTPCGKHQYKIEEIEKSIYMVFATSLYKTGMDEPKELQRIKFILSFIE